MIQTRWVRYQTAAHTSSRQIPPKKSCKYRTWSQFLWHFHYNSYSRMRPSQYLLILTEKNIHTENQKQETAWPTSLHGQQTPRSQTLSRSTWHEKCKCNRHESLWMIKLSPLRSKFQPPNVIYIHEDMLMRHILTFAAAGLWVRNSWEPGWFSPRAAQTTTDVMSKWTACKKNR